MDKIKVMIPSKKDHNAQTVAGFLMLREKGLNIEIIDDSKNPHNLFHNCPVIEVEYQGKKIIYDHSDGYPYPEPMKSYVDWADIYFKRSFSAEKNASFFPDAVNKIYPLGFNYHVTCKKSPMNDTFWKDFARKLLHRTSRSYFTPSVFEGDPHAISDPPKIIFLSRLWAHDSPGMKESVQQQRKHINETRISIIRSLRQRYGNSFIGGLSACPLSRQMAPDLIMPYRLTERKNYLKLLHSCDICIASTGLHESIGWKTAEYVAAAKAIVTEPFHYSVPGEFVEEKNFLTYKTDEECIAAVHRLMNDPALLANMKMANHKYYQEYLRPDILVSNSLRIIESIDNP